MDFLGFSCLWALQGLRRAWCSVLGAPLRARAAGRSCRRSSSKDEQGLGFGYLCGTVLRTTTVEKTGTGGQGSRWRERGEKAEGVWRRRSVWREKKEAEGEEG